MRLYRTSAAAAVIVACAMALVLGSPAAGQCEPGPIEAFRSGSFSDEMVNAPPGSVNCFYEVDHDGDGPESPTLYIGGRFNSAPGVATCHIVSLKDGRWSALGGGLGVLPPYGQLFGDVKCMVMYDEDGPGPLPPALVVGGSFNRYINTPGGPSTPVTYLAKWDGEAWSSIGGNALRPAGSSGGVHALEVFDPDGDGPEHPVLVVGGLFQGPIGSTFWNLAVWDGAEWASPSSTLLSSSQPKSVTIFDADGDGPATPALYVAGTLNFSDLGSGSVVRWSDGEWSIVAPTSPYPSMRALAVYDEDGAGPGLAALYAVGNTSSLGVQSPGIARFDGSAWSSVGGGIAIISGSDGFDLHVHLPDGASRPVLAIGGPIVGFRQTPGGEVTPARGLVTWADGEFRAPSDRLSLSALVKALHSYRLDGSDGTRNVILVGGSLVEIEEASPDGAPLHGLAVWDGDTVQRFGTGPTLHRRHSCTPNEAAAIEFDPDGDGPAPAALYVGGPYSHFGDQRINGIASWNGAGWSPLGDGLASPIGCAALAVWDDNPEDDIPPALYAAGAFTQAGGVPVRGIARWDGAAWSAVGNDLDGTISALAVFDEDGDGPNPPLLFAAGDFFVSGANAFRIARFDGQAWSRLGAWYEPNRPSAASPNLAVIDEDGPGPLPPALWVFDSVWDGSTWQRRTGGERGGLPAAYFDPDGPGPMAGTVYSGAASRLSRWNGSAWELVPDAVVTSPPSGIGGYTGPDFVQSLFVFDEDGDGPLLPALFMGGLFYDDGGQPFGFPPPQPRRYLARYDGVALRSLGGGQGSSTAVISGARAGILAMTSFDVDGPGGDPPSLFAVGQHLAGVAGAGADNIIRWGVRATPIAVTEQPVPQAGRIGQPVTFMVGAAAEADLQYQWRRDGVPLADGGPVSGAATAAITINSVYPYLEGGYDAVVTADCSSVTTDAAGLVVLCTADFSGDESVNSADISVFLTVWLASIDLGTPEADMNGDGVVNSGDISAFLIAWLAAVQGGC